MQGPKVSKNMAIGAGVIGIILLACGLANCICGFVWVAYGAGAHGIWSGIAMLIVGSLGVVILVTKSKAVMIVFLVFCIFDLIINVIQAIVAAIVAALIGILKKAQEDGHCYESNGRCHCLTTNYSASSAWTIDDCDDIKTMHAIFQAITAFSVIGIIVTFTGSIIGCIGACCDKGNDTPGVVVIQQAAGQPVGQMQTTTVQTYQQQPAYPPPPPGQPMNQNTAEMGAVY